MVNAPDVPGSSTGIEAAYSYCERLAREHYENFPVASALLPASMRPHIAAIYAFARRADDFADEPGPDADERLRLLDAWRSRLDRGVSAMNDPAAIAADDLIFLALDHTIRTRQLPRSLFHDLLSAFRQDVTTTRYDTWREVFEYCRRSANPVGRLVLRVAGYDDPALDAPSDALCTALQLTNFWQDLAIDWRRGRLYFPAEERARARARESDLDRPEMTREWRDAVGQAILRTRDLFHAGRPICDAVRGRLRWELRLTWLGGMRILEKIEAADGDVLKHRPTVGRADALVLAWRALQWRKAVPAL
ncbi:MAG: squalene synthase HpnC [Vicinamibacterales bacterium]